MNTAENSNQAYNITIRKLDQNFKRKLRMRAAQNNRSMEAEARIILQQTVLRSKSQKWTWQKKFIIVFIPIRDISHCFCVKMGIKAASISMRNNVIIGKLKGFRQIKHSLQHVKVISQTFLKTDKQDIWKSRKKICFTIKPIPINFIPTKTPIITPINSPIIILLIYLTFQLINFSFI